MVGERGRIAKQGRKEKHYLLCHLPLTPLFHNNQDIQEFRVEDDDGWWVKVGKSGETPKGREVGRRNTTYLVTSHSPPIVS